MKSVYEVGTNVIYAAIQEFGGTITPKNGPFLVFMIDGELVFARQVTIPARPYMRPGFDESRVEAVATIGRNFEALVLRKHYGV